MKKNYYYSWEYVICFCIFVGTQFAVHSSGYSKNNKQTCITVVFSYPCNNKTKEFLVSLLFLVIRVIIKQKNFS